MVFRILDEAGEHTHQMEHVKQHGTVPPEVLRASLSQVVAAIGVQAGFVLGYVCGRGVVLLSVVVHPNLVIWCR